jgi:hypothetical protein
VPTSSGAAFLLRFNNPQFWRKPMQTQSNIQFGSGVFVFTPNAGNLALNPTPIKLKVLQEASVDFKGDLKKLFGQSQFPVATARGKIDVTGKAKVASMDQNDINQIYWGQTVVSGGQIQTVERHVVSASVTPTANLGDGVFVDQGVINLTTGLSMLRVATAPAVGQYTFTPSASISTAASYTFNAAETAVNVELTFLLTVTTGSSLTLTNQLMGFAPVCQAYLNNAFRGAVSGIQLNAVTLGQFSVPTKQEDFWVSDLDFSANCDAGGTLGVFFSS